MENPGDESQSNNIQVKLPVNISYTAVNDFLQKNVVGEFIKTEKETGEVTTYAEILDISLGQSPDEKYDLAVDVEFMMLTKLLRNKIGRVWLYVALEFNEEAQEVWVSDFKLDGKTGNWLMNNSLEVLANNLMQESLKDKMRYNFSTEIEKHIQELNNKMGDPYEVAGGINLFGRIENLRIYRIVPKPDRFLILAKMAANAVVDVDRLDFNAPEETPATPEFPE